MNYLELVIVDNIWNKNNSFKLRAKIPLDILFEKGKFLTTAPSKGAFEDTNWIFSFNMSINIRFVHSKQTLDDIIKNS